MNRRKFLKSFAFIPVALTGGCVATFNGKETKFDPNPVPTEKKHFERSPISSNSNEIPEYVITFESGGPRMLQINPHVKRNHEFYFNTVTGRFDVTSPKKS